MKLICFFFLLSVTSVSMAQTNGQLIGQPVTSGSLLAFCDTAYSFPVKDTWPTGIAWDGRHFWSNGSHLDYIYKYTVTGQIVDSIPSPSSNYGTQELVFEGKSLWALAEEMDAIFLLDTASGAVLRQIDLPFNTNIWGMTSIGSSLYVSYYLDGYIVKIDKASGQIMGNISTPKPIIGIEYFNQTLFGIATNYSYLYKIDPQTGAFLDSVAWCIPYPLGLAWDGKSLWNISSSKQYNGHQRAYQVNIGNFVLSSAAEEPSLASFSLTVNPNPTVDNANIHFNLLQAEPVSVDILDLTGKHQQFLWRGNMPAGAHTLPLITEDLPNGIYFVRLQCGVNFTTQQFVVQH